MSLLELLLWGALYHHSHIRLRANAHVCELAGHDLAASDRISARTTATGTSRHMEFARETWLRCPGCALWRSRVEGAGTTTQTALGEKKSVGSPPSPGRRHMTRSGPQ